MDFGASLMPDMATNATSMARSMAEFRMMQGLQRESMLQQRMAGSMHPAVSRAVNNYLGDGFNPGAMDQHYVNDLLAPFGQQLPEHPAINAFLPSTGFFGNHPRLSAGIEGALLGAANTQGANTIGEGISNAIRGGLGGMIERRDMLNQQYEAPFRNAAMVGQLQHMNALREEDIVNRRKNNAEADWWEKRPDLDQAKLDYQQRAEQDKINNQNNRLAATRPQPVEGGAWVFDNDANKWNFQEGPGGKAAAGGGLEGELIRNVLGPRPSDPKARAAYDRNAWNLYNQHSAVGAGTSAAGADRRQAKSEVNAAHVREFNNYKDAVKKPSSFYQMFGRAPQKGEIDQFDNLLSQWDQKYTAGEYGGSFKDYLGEHGGIGSQAGGQSAADDLKQLLQNPSGASPTPSAPAAPNGKSPMPKIPRPMAYIPARNETEAAAGMVNGVQAWMPMMFSHTNPFMQGQ